MKRLYDENAYMVMGVCLRYCKNEATAEDLVQEAFITVFRKLDQFKGDGALGGWIRRIAVNTAIENWRKEQREKKYIETQNIDYIDEVGPSTIEDHLELEDLLKKIQALPPGYRTVFNLYAIEGYKHHEIAEKLGISVGTSKSQYNRARVMLTKKINTEEIIDLRLNRRHG